MVEQYNDCYISSISTSPVHYDWSPQQSGNQLKFKDFYLSGKAGKFIIHTYNVCLN